MLSARYRRWQHMLRQPHCLRAARFPSIIVSDLASLSLSISERGKFDLKFDSSMQLSGQPRGEDADRDPVRWILMASFITPSNGSALSGLSLFDVKGPWNQPMSRKWTLHSEPLLSYADWNTHINTCSKFLFCFDYIQCMVFPFSLSELDEVKCCKIQEFLFGN